MTERISRKYGGFVLFSFKEYFFDSKQGRKSLRIYLDMCCYNRPYDDQSRLKVAMETQSKLMSKGMKCLTEQMGIIEAERFISILIRERFDYTKWQREYFDGKTPEEISNEASRFEKNHPFAGDAIRL